MSENAPETSGKACQCWLHYDDADWQLLPKSTIEWMLKEWKQSMPKGRKFGDVLQEAQMRAK